MYTCTCGCCDFNRLNIEFMSDNLMKYWFKCKNCGAIGYELYSIELEEVKVEG